MTSKTRHADKVNLLGFGGVNLSNTTALCSEIEETRINNLFIGYIEGTGTAIKQFVCNNGS